jgi:hypothetical protein
VSRSSPTRLAVAILVGSFLCLGVVAGSHFHTPTAAASVRADCSICAVGQSSTHVGAPRPAIEVVAALSPFVLAEATLPLVVGFRALASPRGPPSR